MAGPEKTTHRVFLSLNYSMEFRGDYCAVRNKEFGITTYGKTPEDADSRMTRATGLLLEALMRRGGIGMVHARLSALKIPFVLEKRPQSNDAESFERVQQIELVPA